MDSCMARVNTGFNRHSVCVHSSAGQEADPALKPHGALGGHLRPTTKISVGSSNPCTSLKPHTDPRMSSGLLWSSQHCHRQQCVN